MHTHLNHLTVNVKILFGVELSPDLWRGNDKQLLDIPVELQVLLNGRLEAFGLPPIEWTLSERRIRCPTWVNREESQ